MKFFAPGWGRMAVGAMLLLSIGSACSPPGRGAPEPVDTLALEPAIVRAVDLLTVPGLGQMRRLTPSELPNYQGPELRGACGTVVAQPATPNRLAAAFVGDVAAVSEVVVSIDGSDARELLGDVRATPEDCGPVKAVGSDGRVQTYTPGPEVEISKVGDEHVANRATLTVEEETTYLGTILFRSGDTLIHGQILSDIPIEEETFEGLAKVFQEASKGLASQV